MSGSGEGGGGRPAGVAEMRRARMQECGVGGGERGQRSRGSSFTTKLSGRGARAPAPPALVAHHACRWAHPHPAHTLHLGPGRPGRPRPPRLWRRPHSGLAPGRAGHRQGAPGGGRGGRHRQDVRRPAGAGQDPVSGEGGNVCVWGGARGRAAKNGADGATPPMRSLSPRPPLPIIFCSLSVPDRPHAGPGHRRHPGPHL